VEARGWDGEARHPWGALAILIISSQLKSLSLEKNSLSEDLGSATLAYGVGRKGTQSQFS